MKILLTVLMTSLCVFALATAWVDYVQPQLKQTATVAVARSESATEVPPVKKRVRKAEKFVEPGLVPVPTDEESPLAEAKENSPTASEKQLAERLDEVKVQEARLAARQEALRMIYDDIRTELATVDDLRRRTSDDLQAAERRGMKSAPRQTAAPAASPRNAPPVARSATDTVANRGTAFILRRLVNEGKLETAVSMLKSMKQRDAAGVLETLEATDAKLADRLATSIHPGRDDTVRR